MFEKTGKTESTEAVKVRYLFVDDYAPLINGSNRLFGSNKEFMATECHSVEQAQKIITENRPEVVFLDHSLTPGGNEGLEIVDWLQTTYPDIIIYSTTTNPLISAEYTKRGVKHIAKDDFTKIGAIINS